MKIAFQMESLEDSERGITSSLYMIEEACRRGYEVYHYVPEDLSLDNNGVFAKAARVHVDMDKEKYYELGPYEHTGLTKFTAVFLRQHPPFDMMYVTTTYMLDRLQEAGVFVSNDPSSVRTYQEKISIFDFPEHIVPTLVSRDMSAIAAFFDAHKDIIIKPLYYYSSKGVIRTSRLQDAKEHLKIYPEPLMFQKYIPEIAQGRKRVLYMNGEIVGVRIRVPFEGEYLTPSDAPDYASELLPEEKPLCEKIGAYIKERGLHFVGIDLVGPYLIEINTTCTGGIPRFTDIYGINYAAKFWDMIEDVLSRRG
jgi:glutathione synthase